MRMKTIARCGLGLALAGALAAPAAGEPLTGTAAFQVETSSPVALSKDQTRFNTRLLGSALFQLAGGQAAKMTIACVGQDTTRAGAVVGMTNDCAFEDAAGGQIFTTFDAASMSFKITGGAGRWAGASGAFAADYAPTPNKGSPTLLFVATLKGDLTLK